MKKSLILIFSLIAIICYSQESNSSISIETEKPKRVSYTYAQTLKGSVEDVFPLYCPVKEALWIDGWNPKAVYSYSGLIEENCVFITKGHGDGQDAVWYVTDYNETERHIEMIMVLPETVIMKLIIDVQPNSDNTAKTTLTRSITSIGKSGDFIIQAYTKQEFEKSMKTWEKSMNYYLETGKAMESLTGF